MADGGAFFKESIKDGYTILPYITYFRESLHENNENCDSSHKLMFIQCYRKSISLARPFVPMPPLPHRQPLPLVHGRLKFVGRGRHRSQLGFPQPCRAPQRRLECRPTGRPPAFLLSSSLIIRVDISVKTTLPSHFSGSKREIPTRDGPVSENWNISLYFRCNSTHVTLQYIMPVWKAKYSTVQELGVRHIFGSSLKGIFIIFTFFFPNRLLLVERRWMISNQNSC